MKSFFSAALIAGGLAFAGAARAADRPNVLVILADDLGYSDLGCQGGEIRTPNLDALAAGGLRFTNFYNTARCWPTRSALLTGYYPQAIRMDPPKGRLPQWARLLPHHLKPLGYRCYHSGKWHVMGAPLAVADGGFDRSYLLGDQGRFFSPRRHSEDDKPLPEVKPDAGYYATTAIADHALRCLKGHAEKHAGQPFFGFVAFTAPHFPLHALPEDIARYRDRYKGGWDVVREWRWRRQKDMGLVTCDLSPREPRVVAPGLREGTLEKLGPGEIDKAVAWADLTDEQRAFQATKMAVHAAMVDRMDQEVGRLLAQLRAMKAWENTVIFFLTDNGASAEILVRDDGHDRAAAPGSAASHLCLGPGWSGAANTPFRRHKIWVHEGGIATPLIAHWPKGIAARGALRHDVGHVIDFVPTLLDLAGGKPGDTWNGAKVPPLPGKSLVPAFAGDGAVTRENLYFHHSGNRALRAGSWKLVSAASDGGKWELYNLATDRGESADLAAKHPERVREMAATWERMTADFQGLAATP